MNVITDAICPFCGSLCDDLTIKVENNKITDIQRACVLGHNKIAGVTDHARIEAPLVRKDGELVETTYEDAIERAAEILVNSKRALSYGWSSTSCEAVSKAIELAEETGSVIDSCANVCHGPTTLAVHEKGSPAASLGQVKNRADLVIFWGCNPVHAHPRHMSRYSMYAKGFFTKKGRKGRHIAVVDVRETDTAKIADTYVQVDPGCDFMLLQAIRSAINDNEDVIPEIVGGVPKETILELATMMKEARFSCVFYGMGTTQTRSKYKNGDAVSSLLYDLNQYSKSVMIPMRGHYNVTGFGQVCNWETGYPNAVDFTRKFAYYNPGETGASDTLLRGDVDAALVAAADPGSHFAQEAVKCLAKIPLIQIDPYHNPTTELADIVIPAAVVGVEAEGTAYRMDSIPLRMKKFIDTDFKSDEQIVTDILEKVRELKRGA
ncbi:formylmethanofuran dehydrogenase subunit B [Methanosalsum natronophilum]|nr:formylmethanofuran dehydrogenase subunit B [Methanosalsum natronophilum]MCS3924208.1 formylmethanofuran dehydrogenase subunit B [Methanosalsum natronophilum]